MASHGTPRNVRPLMQHDRNHPMNNNYSWQPWSDQQNWWSHFPNRPPRLPPPPPLYTDFEAPYDCNAYNAPRYPGPWSYRVRPHSAPKQFNYQQLNKKRNSLKLWKHPTKCKPPSAKKSKQAPAMQRAPAKKNVPQPNSKLDSSLKQSIECVLHQKGNSNPDKTESLLNKAEEMCETLRQRRGEDTTSGNGNHGQGSNMRAKVKGYFKASWPVSTASLQKSNDPVNSQSEKLVSQYAQRSAKSQADKGPPVEPRSPRILSPQARSPRTSMALKPRASDGNKGVMARDNLMMLVNAPRTPKQRAQIAQIMGKYSQRQHSERPKLHLEPDVSNSEQAKRDDSWMMCGNTVDLNSLPSDVLAQVQQLINNEIDLEDELEEPSSSSAHNKSSDKRRTADHTHASNITYDKHSSEQYTASRHNTDRQSVISCANTNNAHNRTPHSQPPDVVLNSAKNLSSARKTEHSRTQYRTGSATKHQQMLHGKYTNGRTAHGATAHRDVNSKQSMTYHERMQNYRSRTDSSKGGKTMSASKTPKRPDVCSSLTNERAHPGYTIVRSTEKGKKPLNRHYIFDTEDDNSDDIIEKQHIPPNPVCDIPQALSPPNVTRILHCESLPMRCNESDATRPNERVLDVVKEVKKECLSDSEVETASLPASQVNDSVLEKKKKKKSQSVEAISVTACETPTGNAVLDKSQVTHSKNVKTSETETSPAVDSSRTTDHMTRDNRCDQMTRTTVLGHYEETPKRRRSSSMHSNNSSTEDSEAKRMKQIDSKNLEDNQLLRPISVGTSEPHSVIPPRPDSADLPCPDSVETLLHNSARFPPPESVESPRPDAARFPRPDSVESPRLDSTRIPRPNSVESPRPDSLTIPRHNSVPSPCPNSAETVPSDSADTPATDVETSRPDSVPAISLQSSTSIVNHVLELSLKEEEILKQLFEMNVVIDGLQTKLKSVTDELNSCVAARKQLLKKKKQLRRERLTILKESSSNTAAVNTDTSEVESELLLSNNTCNATIPATTVPAQQPNNISELPTAPICQDNSSVSTMPCVTPAFTEQGIALVDGATNVEQNNAIFAASNVNSSQYCMQYMGTLQSDGISQTPLLLKKLAVNLADMQQVSYMFVEENQFALQNLITARNEQAGPETVVEKKKKRAPSKRKAAAPKAKKVTATKKKTPAATTTKRKTTTKKAASEKKKIPAARAKTTKKVVDNSDVSGLASEQPTEAPFAPARTAVVSNTSESVASSVKSRAKPKASEFYPGPETKVHKKLKSKKERDNIAVQKACHSESEMNDEASAVKPSRKKSSEADKCIQQYLHETSSSDVDLDSLNELPVGSKSSAVASSVDKSECRDYISLLQEDSDGMLTVKTEPTDQSARDWGSFPGHEGPVRSITIWKNHLLTASEDGTVRRFELYARKKHPCLMVYSGHQQGVSCIHVTTLGSEGTRLFTGGYDGKIIIFDYKTGTQIFTHDYSAVVNTMQAAWNLLFIGLGDGNVVRYDFQDYNNGCVLKCAKTSVTAIADTKEGVRKLLCVASNDCTITVRDATWGLLVNTLEGHTKSVLTIKVDKQLVYSGGTDKSVLIHNINTAAPLRTLRFRAVVTGVSLLANTLAVASFDGTVRCLDTQSYKLQRIYYGAGQSAVMTMYLTDSVIYTGNQQGMVEGVALSSAQIRCQFGQCDLVFAKRTYLHHHLMQDHVSTLKQNAQCQWSQCRAFLPWKNNMQASTKHLTEHIFNGD